MSWQDSVNGLAKSAGLPDVFVSDAQAHQQQIDLAVSVVSVLLIALGVAALLFVG